jgi:NADH-quinone oxidoreductase subunit N
MLVANATGREDLEGYRGLAYRGGALAAVALAVFLFSLAGLPPLAGFLGKFYVFAAGVEGRLYALVMIGLVNSVVSLYYYARIVKVMFLDRPEPDDQPMRLRLIGDLGVVGVLAAANLVLILRFEWLLALVQSAGRVFTG